MRPARLPRRQRALARAALAFALGGAGLAACTLPSAPAATTTTVPASTTTAVPEPPATEAQRARAGATVVAVFQLAQRAARREPVADTDIDRLLTGRAAETMRQAVANPVTDDPGTVRAEGVYVVAAEDEVAPGGQAVSEQGEVMRRIIARGHIAAVACVRSADPAVTLPQGFGSYPAVMELVPGEGDDGPRLIDFTLTGVRVGDVYGIVFAGDDPLDGVTCSFDGTISRARG